ncbi:MAG: methyltransferase domain-containing protein [bacterium]|nr:methyltransferase domain-containing protein [bacterium]
MKTKHRTLKLLDQKADQFAKSKASRFPLNNSIERFNNPIDIGFRKDSSEIPFLEWLVKCLPSQGSILDVGSGDGRVAKLLRNKGLEVTCLEPASNRAAELRQQKFSVLEGTFLEYSFDESFNTVLFCRSIGLASMRDAKVQLSDTLCKAADLSNDTIIFVMPPEEILVHKLFRKERLPLFKKPLFQFHLLQLLSLKIPLREISHSYYVINQYQSVQDCLQKDFSKTSWNQKQLSQLESVLPKVMSEGFERRVHWMVRYCEVNAKELGAALDRT